MWQDTRIIRVERALKMENIKYRSASLSKQKGLNMFAVGHLSLSYLIAIASSRPLKVKLNLSMIFLLGLIPDTDLVIPGLQHRTLTHSIIILTIAFLPAFAIYKKNAIPYFAALAQHSLIGDSLTGEGIQLFWPITQTWYGLGLPITSISNIFLEWTSFLVAIAIILATKDMQKLLTGNRSNLFLLVPLATVLLPSFLYFPLKVPPTLLIPHLLYLGLFITSLLSILRSFHLLNAWGKTVLALKRKSR